MSIYSFTGTEVGMVLNGVLDMNAPVDPSLYGMSLDQLHDESVIGVEPYASVAAGRRWYPVVNSSTPLTPYQSYNDDGVYSFDAAAKCVRVVYTIRDWTPEEIRAWQLSHARMVSMRGLHFRFTDDERVKLAEAIADKPGATAEEQHAITVARVLHDAVFWDRYGLTMVDLNHPGFQASVQKMEEVGLIAAGRADQILWIDPKPYEGQ